MAADLLIRPAARLPWAFAAASLALAGYFGWQAHAPDDHGDPVATEGLRCFEHRKIYSVFPRIRGLFGRCLFTFPLQLH